jgi:hypothetical protein
MRSFVSSTITPDWLFAAMGVVDDDLRAVTAAD